MATQKIVIGVILALIVIAFFIWLYNRSKKSTTTTSTPTNTGTGERVEQTIQQPIISQPVYNQGFSYGGAPVAGNAGGRFGQVGNH